MRIKMIIFKGVCLVCLTATALWGCAKAPVQEDTIAELRREITRLKAERANLDVRSTVLDDKVVVLERQLRKCSQGDKKGLTVVKLTPHDEEETVWESEPIRLENKRRQSNRAEKRPVLVLNNSRTRRSPQSQRLQPQAQTHFRDLGADNLGVTNADSMPANESRAAMESFNAAYQAYSNKNYSVALQGFAGFVNGHPKHEYADNAIFWRGECYLAMGKLANAIGEYQRLKRRYPHSEKVASSVYKIGLIYDKMRDFGKAAEHYFEVVERYPKSDEARRASRRVAEIRNQNGNASGIMPTSYVR